MKSGQPRRYLLSALLLVASHPVFAGTVSVGNCRPSLQKFSTISQAVSSVPAASTILVCPGVYRGQVIISQPLTLTGVQDENAANPKIAVKSGGLTQSVNSQINGIPIFFQILVKDTESGEVNISNIAVDGTNSRVPDAVVGLAGILLPELLR
jgi:pectin methylesterase-like acyl-CoA thioesterase